MKLLLCIAAWICFANLGVSQAIFFPQADYADSASLARAMPILAKRVIAEYRNPDTSAWYGTLYRAQIVAQEYAGAERTLAAYSEAIEPDSTFRCSIAFSYKIYCRVMALKEADRGRPLRDLYDEAFTELFRPLSEKERENAGFFFTYDLTEFKKTLDELIASQRNVQRTSYAEDRTTRHLLEPNTIEQIELANTFMTSIRLTKGSRIVVMVGVNLNPQWQINYGTGKDVSDEDIRDANTPLEVKWYTTGTIKIPVWR